MQTKQILYADVLDILFDGKNKEYGAYQLRKTYNKRIAWALAGTMLACLLFLVGTLLASEKKSSKPPVFVKDVELARIKDVSQPKVPKAQPQPQPQSQARQAPVQTLRNMVPVIVPDPQVKPEDQVKTIAELTDAKIGSVDNNNGGKDDIVTSSDGKNILGANGNDVKATEGKEEGAFIPVQLEAEFPGGKEGWRKYLERNLNSSIPSENGAPAGKYSVLVSFMVDAGGNISDVVAENDPGYGAKEEAIRIIKKGPKWRPALQNGRNVAYRVRQQVTFEVTPE